MIEGDFDESTATDIATKVQEYLEDDFGDGFGARSAYHVCNRNGAEIEFIDDFKNAFDSKYIVKESLDFGSGGLEYKIPSETYLKFISNIPNLNDYDELDSDYILYLLYEKYATRRIFSEPRYGWEGFDIEQWNNACKNFQEFLNSLFDKNK